MARDFVVSRPQEPDAPRIAEIHLAAMDSNPLLHAQFPAREGLAALQQFLETYAAEQLRDSASGVLVARNSETGVIAGFAKWDSPSHPENVKLESGELRYLQGCRREFLDGYASLAEEAKKRYFGDHPCYRTFIRQFLFLRCFGRLSRSQGLTRHRDRRSDFRPHFRPGPAEKRSADRVPARPDSPGFKGFAG